MEKEWLFRPRDYIHWFGFTVALIISSIDSIVKNEMSLTMLAIYYVLFLFLFAFIYNLIAWHSPGSVEKLGLGWTAEIQCLILSVSMMTGSGHTTAQPKNAVSDSIASVQSLIGLAFVAVFIAKAVSVVSAAPKCG